MSLHEQIRKLQEEAFIEHRGDTLIIHGDIWSGSIDDDEGTIIPFFEISFVRSGRRVPFRLSLVDILEWFQFNSGETKITIEKMRR